MRKTAAAAAAPVVDRSHNQPPEVLDAIEVPDEDIVLSDLKKRYPKVEADFEDIRRSYESCPKRIEDNDDETAASVQELAKKIAVTLRAWEQARSNEKTPWQKIANCVSAFWSTKSEVMANKETGWLPDLKARHTNWLERKATRVRAEQEEKARQQRAEAERLARENADAARRKMEAEAAEAAAKAREEASVRAAAAAQERQRVAEEAAKLAAEEEARIAREKATRGARERAEAARIQTSLVNLLTEAASLNGMVESGKASPEQESRLLALLENGSPLVNAGIELSHLSHALTEDQNNLIVRARAELAGMRTMRDRRAEAARAELAAFERTRRLTDELTQTVKFVTVTMSGVETHWEALQTEPWTGRKDLDKLIDPSGILQGKIEAALTSEVIGAEVHASVVAFDERLDVIRAGRQAQLDAKVQADLDAEIAALESLKKARAQAAAAEEERRVAQADAREARTEQRQATKDIRSAERETRVTSELAEKAESRADRMDATVDNTSDAGFSRTRSVHGTVGSLGTRWTVDKIDEDVVRDGMGPLGPYVNADAIRAAAYRFMQVHMKHWAEETNTDALPGVTFAKVRESRIA